VCKSRVVKNGADWQFEADLCYSEFKNQQNCPVLAIFEERLFLFIFGSQMAKTGDELR
jgi:hypothetical protein